MNVSPDIQHPICESNFPLFSFMFGVNICLIGICDPQLVMFSCIFLLKDPSIKYFSTSNLIDTVRTHLFKSSYYYRILAYCDIRVFTLYTSEK